MIAIPLEAEAAHVEPPRRHMLWQIHESMHCSIVGTCLDRSDIKSLLRKSRLAPAEGSSDYEVHGWLVRQVACDTPLSKGAHKWLDRKHAGALRRHARLEDGPAILDFWEQARRGGDLAGAYWAIASDQRTDLPLRRRIFGDIHMLSHHMIGRNRSDARALVVAEERIERLEQRLQRARQAQALALAERDERIAGLECQARRLSAAAVSYAARPRPEPAPATRIARLLEAQRRRALVARAQLKELQAESQRLRQQLALLTTLLDEAPASGRPQPDRPGANLPESMPSVAGAPGAAARRWLYVGGRPGSQQHLRRRAERLCASLSFHDGGLEQSLHGLDDLVAQADLVFCPIDCVSHGACLRAKHLCRRLAKPFVPLRSASSSHFHVVAAQITAEPAPDEPAPDEPTLEEPRPAGGRIAPSDGATASP